MPYNPDTLRKDWLFSGADKAFLSELAPHWVISAEGEGRKLLDEARNDTCIVVVRGVVEVRVRTEGASEHAPPLIRRVTSGNIINVTGLLGGTFGEQVVSAEVVHPSAADHGTGSRPGTREGDRAPPEIRGGTTASDAEKLALQEAFVFDSDEAPPPALIIKLSQSAFKKIAAKPAFSMVEPRMRRISASLSPLLTLEGLIDPTGTDGYGPGKARRINRSNAMAEGVPTKPGSPGSLRASPSLDDGGEADEDTIMRLPSRLPDKMIKLQMEVLARKQRVEVLHKVNEVLFETAEFQGDNVELRKAAMAMDARGRKDRHKARRHDRSHAAQALGARKQDVFCSRRRTRGHLHIRHVVGKKVQQGQALQQA